METTFTVAFPFCGLGAGALGFLQAQVALLGRTARFHSLGGIDVDAEACEDFIVFPGSEPAWFDRRLVGRAVVPALRISGDRRVRIGCRDPWAPLVVVGTGWAALVAALVMPMANVDEDDLPSLVFRQSDEVAAEEAADAG